MATTGNYLNANDRGDIPQQSASAYFLETLQKSADRKQALELEAQKADAEFKRNLHYKDLLNAAENAKSGAFTDNSEIGRATVNVANPTYAGTKVIKSPALPANGMMSLVGGGYGDVNGALIASVPQTPTQELGQTAKDMAMPVVQNDPRYSMEFNGTKFGIQDNKKEQDAFLEKAANAGVDPYENGRPKTRTQILSELAGKDKVTRGSASLQARQQKATEDLLTTMEINKVKKSMIVDAEDATKRLTSGVYGRLQRGWSKNLQPDDPALADYQKVKMVLLDAQLANVAFTKGAISDAEMKLFGEASANDELMSSPRMQVVFNKLNNFMKAQEKSKLDSYKRNYGDDPRNWPELQDSMSNGEQSFASEAEAEAANLPKGTVVIINGRRAQVN